MDDISFGMKLKNFIQEQKYILLLIFVVICAAVFLFLFIQSHNAHPGATGLPTSNQPSSVNAQKNSGSIVSKVMSILFHTENQNTQSGSSQSGQSTQVNQNSSGSTENNGVSNGSTNTSMPGQSSTSQGQNGSQQSNGSSNGIGDQSPQNDQGNNPNQTNFQIIFQGPNGPEIYTPPATPPTQVNWVTYTDDTYHYSIQYPAGWQVVNGQTSFSKGLTLFLPGEDTTDISQKYIAFGWSNYNLFPAIALNNDGATTSPAIVTGVTGTIYTKGPMGISYIVSLFPYENGYFGLITYSSDPTIAYIYQYMMQSLTFNIQ